jgi:hypothetical protein
MQQVTKQESTMQESENNKLSFNANYILDKAHFNECFEQSAAKNQLKDYRKAAILLLMGIALMFVESEQYYVAYFLCGLGVIDYFSVQHKQAWWVWRQLWSKSAQNKVNLTFDHQGIKTESKHINTQLLWQDISHIDQTEKGLLLKSSSGTHYLSNKHLDQDTIAFILSQGQNQKLESDQKSEPTS